MIPLTDKTKSEWINEIEERILGRNAERDRKILARRLLDGIVFEKLAEEFDLSVQQTKNIVYKRQSQLFK